jgi:hypothetical protein
LTEAILKQILGLAFFGRQGPYDFPTYLSRSDGAEVRSLFDIHARLAPSLLAWKTSVKAAACLCARIEHGVQKIARRDRQWKAIVAEEMGASLIFAICFVEQPLRAQNTLEHWHCIRFHVWWSSVAPISEEHGWGPTGF